MTVTGPAAVPDEQLVAEELGHDLAAASFDLARRFHHGGTMWVLAPQWEPHAHHVAVEFVHPVIVGKRALPAVAIVGHDPIEELRLATAPGDVVVLVAHGTDPIALGVAARGPAWGVDVVWIGHGPRPDTGLADHVLWVDDEDPMVPSTGRFVLLYHLLWELTHVCFEHPGLLTDPEACTDEVCITCSDEGRLAEVQHVPSDPFAPTLVRTSAGEEEVDTSLVGEVRRGDLVLVHAGSALTRVDLPAGAATETGTGR